MEYHPLQTGKLDEIFKQLVSDTRQQIVQGCTPWKKGNTLCKPYSHPSFLPRGNLRARSTGRRNLNKAQWLSWDEEMKINIHGDDLSWELWDCLGKSSSNLPGGFPQICTTRNVKGSSLGGRDQLISRGYH